MNIKNYKELNREYSLLCNNGCTAQIYKSKYDNEILKIFRSELSQFDEDRFNYLSKINTDYFSFPLDNVYINNSLVGYTMYFKEGISFKNMNYDILIKDLFGAIEKLEYDFSLLSDYKIRILDLHEDNILYDRYKKNINIIDTDEYGCFYENKKDLLKKNIKSLAYIISSYLSLDISMYDDFNSFKSLLQYLNMRINILEETYKVSLEKVEDIKKLKLKKISKAYN